MPGVHHRYAALTREDLRRRTGRLSDDEVRALVGRARAEEREARRVAELTAISAARRREAEQIAKLKLYGLTLLVLALALVALWLAPGWTS